MYTVFTNLKVVIFIFTIFSYLKTTFFRFFKRNYPSYDISRYVISYHMTYLDVSYHNMDNFDNVDLENQLEVILLNDIIS
jgi:hypothetical protein